MKLPFAVVGAGRLGTALARSWHDAGWPFLGFVGRPGGDVGPGLRFVGAGRALQPPALRAAAVVVIAVPDDTLVDWVRDAAAHGAAAGADALWLHTSGAFGAEVLAPLQRALGCRVGGFHPLCPVPDAATGLSTLRGAPVWIEVPQTARDLAERLAAAAGMRALPPCAGDVDRTLYHAACALAANGTTALLALAAALLQRAAPGLGAAPAAGAVASLGRSAAERCAADGPTAALSGPVLRGDAELIARHLRVLAADAAAVEVYGAVMRVALSLAEDRGLDPARARAVAAALAAARPGGAGG